MNTSAYAAAVWCRCYTWAVGRIRAFQRQGKIKRYINSPSLPLLFFNYSQNDTNNFFYCI